MPGASPESTTALKAALFLSPFCFSNSERFNRHHMHQQPPQAPRSPKSSSRSLHRSGVREWYWNFFLLVRSIISTLSCLLLLKLADDYSHSIGDVGSRPLLQHPPGVSVELNRNGDLLLREI